MKKKVIATNIQAYKISDTDCENFCLKAKAYGICRVILGPSSLPLAFKMLDGSGIEIGTSISYPSGAFFADAKVDEIEELEKLYPQIGAYYVVMAVGRFLSGYEADAEEEIKAVKKAAGNKKVYIITEASLLNDAQMQMLCKFAADAGLEGIVDTTGFTAYDVPFPTEEELRRLVQAANEKIKVLANGGADSAEKIECALSAGADSVIVTNIDVFS